jgi:hypothetical protein
MKKQLGYYYEKITRLLEEQTTKLNVFLMGELNLFCGKK